MYQDKLRIQIFLADHDIPMSYTDTISNSELYFLFDTMTDYIKEKNQAMNGG